MNKNILIGGAVALLLILGVGVYIGTKGENADRLANQAQVDKVMNKDIVDEDSFTGSLSDLVRLGKNYSCTFKVTDDAGNVTEGETFVAASGNKLSSNYTLKQTDGNMMEGNMISDGEYSYMWTSMQPQGFKMKLDLTKESLFDAPKSQKEDETSPSSIADDVDMDFDCDRWSVDNSKFTPPSNIEFVDFSQQMMQMQEQIEQMPKADCSVCDSVPAEGKAQCLQALGC